tara:strand:+ start:40 stop:237 length:198 start_codon:yes stop_codon:yes gene_type:complete
MVVNDITKGNLVELIHSDHLNRIIGVGTRGVVLAVYGDGSVDVKWEKGGRISMLPQLGDAFKLVG